MDLFELLVASLAGSGRYYLINCLDGSVSVACVIGLDLWLYIA